MPTYICELCSFTSTLKGNYKQHLDSKKHRLKTGQLKKEPKIYGVKMKMSQNDTKMSQNEPINNNPIIISSEKLNKNENESNFLKEQIEILKCKLEQKEIDKKNFFCENCGTFFSSKASKRRHQLHRCKVKNAINTLIEDLEAKHKEEKDALHNKIDQLIDKVGNRTTNITNNTQNIILNNYGNEDMSHITNDIKTNLLKIPFAMIPKMIEAVHFNDEKPENKNILLPNKKDNLVKIFKENKWIHLNKDDVIKLLVSEKYNILDKHFENKHKNKIEELKELQEFWKENYVNFRKIYSNGNKELIDKITNECELVLLNNR